jgi:hypothetical protein
MLQLVHHPARAAFTARISRSGLLAEQVACVSKGQRQVPATAGSEKELRMGHAPFAHVADEHRLEGVMADEAGEEHWTRNYFRAP